MEKTKKPFISIISPISNEEQFIGQCLASLVNQDYNERDLEILVVDGMSTDRTRQIVQEYAEKHAHVRLFDNPAKTAPHALNVGLQYAKGDIIIRVDGHAVIEKDYVKKCVAAMAETDADCVGGVIESINESYTGKGIALAMSHPFGVGNSRFRTSGKAGYVDSLAFGAYKKSVFERIGNFDTELVRCQDDDFNYRLRKHGGKIYFTPEIKSFYYPRSNLKKLWKQYFYYGFWKVRVLQKHPKQMQVRQFVPPAFVFSLILSLLMGPLFSDKVWLWLSNYFLYIFASFSAAMGISLKKGIRFLPILPAIFAILHLSYGAGFLIGLIRFAGKWSEESRKQEAKFLSTQQA
jgi:glycosyltransferase involved in cell wall biosynthesis